MYIANITGELLEFQNNTKFWQLKLESTHECYKFVTYKIFKFTT